MNSSNVGRPPLSPPATNGQRVQTTKSAIRQSLEKGLANPELRAEKEVVTKSGGGLIRKGTFKGTF